MADVYLAEQMSLGRPVAIKVLRPETVRLPGAVERFAQEARAAAALVHGNIVQIHEVACVDGVHFLAEEYVAGPSLGAWLVRRGPLDGRQALAVLGQVGAALSRAAGQGIVHRDIKPENLLVTPAGEVKVADFGLARVIAEDVGLTQAGMTVGTPLYMSPEQGQGRAVDSRSDLYSLGATVYHLLAGRPPFTGPTAVSVVLAHVSAPLPRLAAVRTDVPPAILALVERLLAKDPSARFAGPADLVHAVEEVEAELFPGPRRGPSPLVWEGAVESWQLPASTTGSRRVADGMTAPAVRAATQRLQAVIERAEAGRVAARRRWMATAAAAVVAGLVGFAAGRFRQRRGPSPRPAR
jgi:serine/threonine-protein kinase